MPLSKIFSNRAVLCAGAMLLGVSLFAGTGAVSVLNVTGQVEFSTDGRVWRGVAAGAQLAEGTFLKTARGAAADLVLDYNGSVLRLTSDSELQVERLGRLDTGVETITETRLNVTRGSLVGSQRKLHRPSVLAITTPAGSATIMGTEYIVSKSGAVSVLSGSVDVTCNLPGNKGSVKVTVTAGQTFDPATGKVVATTPAYLQPLLADVNTVKKNAETFKAGGATLVVKPNEEFLSPTNPKGNNGVGNGVDPQPPGNPPINDGPGTGPGNPGNQGGSKK